MNPPYAAQDAARCQICETAVVHMHCHSCEVNLCMACIGNHVTLNPRTEHQVLGLDLHKSSLTFTKCCTHPNQCCQFYCKECDIPVCSKCISSEKHSRHLFLQMCQVFESRKSTIEKDTKALEDVVCPKYENIAQDIENELKNLESEFKRITTMVFEHGKEWHRRIDLLVSRLKTEINAIRENQIYALRKQLSHVKNKIIAINDAIDENNGALSSKEVIRTLDCKIKFTNFNQLPPALYIQSPIFSTRSITDEEVSQLFGSLKTLPITVQKESETLNDPTKLSPTQFLEEPELVSSFYTSFQKLCNVEYKNAENIWTSGKDGTIKKFNLQGSCLKTIITSCGTWPADIAWNHTGELLYSDSVARSLKIVKRGPVKNWIKFKFWKPGNICVCFSGDLLVTLCNDEETQVKVVRYSGPTEKQTIQFDEEGKPLYSGNSKIKYISENRNLDVCVADSHAGVIVVVNQAGRFRFRYTGHPNSSKAKPFKPYGITTDSWSQILTSDSDNHCIHILDQTGQFLHYIKNCHLQNPHGLCVDDRFNLIMAEYYSGMIKIIKYIHK